MHQQKTFSYYKYYTHVADKKGSHTKQKKGTYGRIDVGC